MKKNSSQQSHYLHAEFLFQISPFCCRCLSSKASCTCDWGLWGIWWSTCSRFCSEQPLNWWLSYSISSILWYLVICIFLWVYIHRIAIIHSGNIILAFDIPWLSAAQFLASLLHNSYLHWFVCSRMRIFLPDAWDIFNGNLADLCWERRGYLAQSWWKYPYVYAATITVNPLTALLMLEDFVKLKSGTSILLCLLCIFCVSFVWYLLIVHLD